MALYHHSTKRPTAVGDSRPVLGRDGAWIKEGSGVVEFDPVGGSGRKLAVGVQGKIDLGGDSAGRDRFLQSVTPEIAHQAVPRAFSVGQEDG